MHRAPLLKRSQTFSQTRTMGAEGTTAFSQPLSPPFLFGSQQSHLNQSQPALRTAVRRRRHWFMSDDVSPDKKAVDMPSDFFSPQVATSSGRAAATVQAVLDDLATRPEYYLNVFGVVFGIILSIVVLSATVIALDSLPLVPDALRMIGLVYLFWFLKKYLFSATERKRLGDEVDDFVAGIRGPVVNNIRSEQLTETDS